MVIRMASAPLRPFFRYYGAELAAWCLARKGQVIACERAGASWLDRMISHWLPIIARKAVSP